MGCGRYFRVRWIIGLGGWIELFGEIETCFDEQVGGGPCGNRERMGLRGRRAKAVGDRALSRA